MRRPIGQSMDRNPTRENFEFDMRLFQQESSSSTADPRPSASSYRDSPEENHHEDGDSFPRVDSAYVWRLPRPPTQIHAVPPRHSQNPQQSFGQGKKRSFNPDEVDFIIDAFGAECTSPNTIAGFQLLNISGRSLVEHTDQTQGSREEVSSNQFLELGSYNQSHQQVMVKPEIDLDASNSPQFTLQSNSRTRSDGKVAHSEPKTKKRDRKMFFSFLGGSGSSFGSNGSGEKASAAQIDYPKQQQDGQITPNVEITGRLGGHSDNELLHLSSSNAIPHDTQQLHHSNMYSTQQIRVHHHPVHTARNDLRGAAHHRSISSSSASSSSTASHGASSKPSLAEKKRKSGEFLKSISGRTLIRSSSGAGGTFSKKRRSEPIKLESSPVNELVDWSRSSIPIQSSVQGDVPPTYPTAQHLRQPGSFSVSTLIPFLKRNKKPWEAEEEKMILHVVYYFVEKDLRTISRIAQKCDVNRSARAIDKKLKRILNFEKWNLRVQGSIQETIRRMYKESNLALSPEQRLKLEIAKREFGDAYPPLESDIPLDHQSDT